MRTDFALFHYHKWSIRDLDNMHPWEREIYIALLMQSLEEEKNRAKQ